MVNFSSSVERITKIDNLVKKGFYPDRSTFINKSIDLHFKELETKKYLDFMYFVSIPFGLFLGCLGLTFTLKSLFWYILSSIFGVYLVVFLFLFISKYREVKK
jgi:hypothetical protein